MFTIRRKPSALPLLCALVVALASMAVAVGADGQPPALTVDGPERSLREWGYFTFSGTTSDDVGTTVVHIKLDGWVNNLYTISLHSMPGETKAWSMTELIGGGTMLATITAEDAAGNRTNIEHLYITPHWPSSGPDPLGLEFISPIPQGDEHIIVPSRRLSGARLYAGTTSGRPAVSVRYQLLHATTGDGEAMLRTDGDWELPELVLEPGNTTIRATATDADGRTSDAWIDLFTEVDAPAAKTNSHDSHTCGAGSGLGALILGLACIGLRRRRW